MITTVATFSLDQAREFLDRRPGQHPFSNGRRAWVGFDTGSIDQSPLRKVDDGPSRVVRMADWDPECKWRGHAGHVEDEPTIAIARAIVPFVVGLHLAQERFALAVHCKAGLWRSGAVAEFVRVDLGVPEHECSNRLIDVLVGGKWEGERTFNATLLRLLREAFTERAR
jgi:hypothetical protein